MGNRHMNRSAITRIQEIGAERRIEFDRAFGRIRNQPRPAIQTVLEHLRRLNDERERLMTDFGR